MFLLILIVKLAVLYFFYLIGIPYLEGFLNVNLSANSEKGKVAFILVIMIIGGLLL